MKYFLGLDGGGTKTESVIINEAAEQVSTKRSGGSNALATDYKVALSNLKQTVISVSLSKKPLFSCLAIAGVNSKVDADRWREEIEKDAQLAGILVNGYEVINDTQAALRAGTEDKNAIVLIAGTGSICYGINEKGENAISGGKDYILSDEGAGYFIGQRILQAVVKAEDGRAKSTKLVSLLYKMLKISSVDELAGIVYEKPWNKADIAALSVLIEEAIGLKDETAQRIVKDAVKELCLLVQAVATKLELERKDYSLVTVGSVFKIQKQLYDVLVKKVLVFSPKVKFVVPHLSSATGAALLARDLMLDYKSKN